MTGRKEKEMELTIIKGKELSNKSLNSKFNAINKAIESVGRNTWNVAEKVSDIVTPNKDGEILYMSDFESVKDLAQYMNVSPAFISNCKKAVETNKSLLLKEQGYTVSQVYELSLASDISTFMIQYDISNMDSAKTIRQYVKEYNEANKSDDNVAKNPPYIDPNTAIDDFDRNEIDKSNKATTDNWNKSHPNEQYIYENGELRKIEMFDIVFDGKKRKITEECYFSLRDTLSKYNYL